jgi:molecular chaperone IbpA|tara:strand:+ start:526 stop:984 length:459 start_codon:yes stop_codon:yes gene_type:complete
MSNLAFTNFPRDTFLGFDSLFNTLAETNVESARGVGYPPYNVIKRDDGHFLIEIAVAGFKKEDINLTLEKGVLTITGRKEGHTDKREYTHRGISQRAFERSFTISETIKVVGADIVDGLLVVILENDIPEEDKPQTINLGDLPKHAKKLLLG